jgi:hypothetical protein
MREQVNTQRKKSLIFDEQEISNFVSKKSLTLMSKKSLIFDEQEILGSSQQEISNLAH